MAKKAVHASKKRRAAAARQKRSTAKSKKTNIAKRTHLHTTGMRPGASAVKRDRRSTARHGSNAIKGRHGTAASNRRAPAAQKQAPRPAKAGVVDSAEMYARAASVIINSLGSNDMVSSYLRKNVSKRAIEVVELLNSPKTDEEIADKLGLKINAVRRILNIMQGYGITNYNISKNVDGWLSFAWYINVNKIGQFLDYVKNMTQTGDVVKDNCNDYFICKNCYDDNKLIFTFDAAYEARFRCTCNGMLTRIDRIEADRLVREANEQISAESAQKLAGADDEQETEKGAEAASEPYKLAQGKKYR
ncbi:hypothetical protein M1329_00075 [Candidatus Marsarchaeota archaeon]|nr:hypothetical protein [Candidatus Marsarchaeota archaeon]MCL5100005.1 hypothetical protein [Candidatus Marsarchaeota archaeon]